MGIPIDPGTALEDNVHERILLAGNTGLHKRFKNLYDMFSGNIAQDNLNPKLLGLSIGSRRPGDMLNVGFFIGGVGNGTLTIKQANGNSFADTDGNRGYIWMRSATNGSIIRGKIVADVSLSPVGMKPGQAVVDDLTAAILRVYAINDGNSVDDFTPKWGLCYQGGFQSIRNFQDFTTAANVTVAERFFVNANISTDNSPVSDMGYAFVDLDYTGNPNGEKFWTFTSTHPGESADGIFQPFSGVSPDFSVQPTVLPVWTMNGQEVTVIYSPTAPGTSSGNQFSMFSPTLVQSPVNFPVNNITNNGVKLTTASYGVATGFQIGLFPDANAGNWAAANSKSASFVATYEAHKL